MATIEGIILKIKEVKPELHPVVQNVVKNTVQMTGLCLKSEQSNVAPIVYIDRMLSDEVSDEDAATQIIEILNHNTLDLDISRFRNRDYILSNIYLGLQRADDNCNYLTKESPWDNIIEYMYIRDVTGDGSSYSVKVTDSLLENAGIDVLEAWSAAKKATCNEIDIQSIMEVFGEIFPESKLCEFVLPFYIASNALKVNGAAVALNEEYIRKWACDHDFHKVVIIFSSIHEALLLPVEENEFDLEDISNMMKEVNATQVDEVEQLSDKAYILNI